MAEVEAGISMAVRLARQSRQHLPLITATAGSFLNPAGNGLSISARARRQCSALGRDGQVIVEFEAEGMQRLTFAGRATNYSRDFITAELGAGARSRNVRANASIYVDPSGQVDHISMEGMVDGDPFKLNWRAR